MILEQSVCEIKQMIFLYWLINLFCIIIDLIIDFYINSILKYQT